MDLICLKTIDAKQGSIRAIRFNGKNKLRFLFIKNKISSGVQLSVNVTIPSYNNKIILVDGSYCLTCGADKKIKLWNPHKNLMLKVYGGHGNEVLDAVGSCDSSQIASCGSDKSVILWDVSTGQPLRRFRGHAGSICCVKWEPLELLVPTYLFNVCQAGSISLFYFMILLPMFCIS